MLSSWRSLTAAQKRCPAVWCVLGMRLRTIQLIMSVGHAPLWEDAMGDAPFLDARACGSLLMSLTPLCPRTQRPSSDSLSSPTCCQTGEFLSYQNPCLLAFSFAHVFCAPMLACAHPFSACWNGWCQ